MTLTRKVALAALAAILTGAIVLHPSARAQEGAGWKAYVEGKKGETDVLPGSPTALKDKEWLQVKYTDYAGFKPRVGVVLSDEKRGTPNPYHSEWARLVSDIYGTNPGTGTNPFNHIEDMVRQALMTTNRFTMVERTTATEDVLGEQDFGASGRVEKKTAAAIGHMKGAEYIVKATIIELNPQKESRDIRTVAGAVGMRTAGLGSVGVTGKVAFCRLNVRLVNATTGEIVQDLTVDGTAKSSGLVIGGGIMKAATGGAFGAGTTVGTKKSAALSDAMQACANKAAYFTAIKLAELPWQGAVASVNGDKVIINAGTNVGLKVGQTLSLLAKGEAIVDPDDASSVLGYDTKSIGAVRIVEVQDRFATCEILQGGQGAKRGDIVRLEPAKEVADR